MNEQDKAAFEKWFDETADYGKELTLKEAWQAALEYERKRSEKLVESLEKVKELLFDNSHPVGIISKMVNEAEIAIAEYKLWGVE